MILILISFLGCAKDILHVRQMLGHTSIANALVYTHLVNFEEDEELLKFGFVYVTDRDLIRICRKRK